MDKEIIDSHFIFLFAFCDDNLDGFNILKGLFFNGSLKFFIFFFSCWQMHLKLIWYWQIMTNAVARHVWMVELALTRRWILPVSALTLTKEDHVMVM